MFSLQSIVQFSLSVCTSLVISCPDLPPPLSSVRYRENPYLTLRLPRPLPPRFHSAACSFLVLPAPCLFLSPSTFSEATKILTIRARIRALAPSTIHKFNNLSRSRPPGVFISRPTDFYLPVRPCIIHTTLFFLLSHNCIAHCAAQII